MVKSINKLAFKKLVKNKFLLIGLALLIIIGVVFFVSLFSIVKRYEETAEIYFKDYVYADCTFYGSFANDNVTTVNEQGAQIAEGRYVKDYRNGEIIYRAISITQNINKLYYYSGSAPKENECVILKKNADALKLKLGDAVTIDSHEFKISGIIGSPEYIYLVKNERSMMSDPLKFAVVYLNESFFEGNFDEILAENLSANFNNKDVKTLIGADNTLMYDQQINYNGYKDDLEQIQSFAYIFPAIFAFLIFVMVYVILKRTAAKERKQIAVYKALGLRDKEITKIYLTQFIITFFIAAIAGCLATIPVIKLLIKSFTSMFELPLLNYRLYPWLWIGSIIVSLIICIIPGLLSIRNTLKIEPAEAMRPKLRAGGRKALIEKTFLWKKFSFNTRYTFKSMLRSKVRFLSIVVGITGAIALLLVSFGFSDSIKNTRDAYFDNFARYDITANFQPVPFNYNVESINHLSSNDEYAKALQMRTQIKDLDCNVTVVDEGFNFLNIDYNLLKDGVIVPEYFAKEWKVKAGDTLEIEGVTVKISAIFTQTMALSLYTSYDYFMSVSDYNKIYNTLFIRGENLENLTLHLNSNNITYSTIDDDNATFESISQTITMLILLMSLCAIILGMTVMYTVGLMNLSARENEYMLLNTLGYSHKKIMVCYIKEILMQIILAVPLGIAAGILLLFSIQGKFSNSGFVVKATVLPLSYIASLAVIIGIGAIMYFVTNRQIGKIDIVQGLKAQDD